MTFSKFLLAPVLAAPLLMAACKSDDFACLGPQGRAEIHFPVALQYPATVQTIVGSGEKGFSGDGGAAISAAFNTPGIVAWGPDGAAYITDVFNHRIRKFEPATGVVTTVAGNGEEGYNGDNIPATEAHMNRPREVVVDGEGNLFFVDLANHRLRRVDAETGTITTIAGTGRNHFTIRGWWNGRKKHGVFNGDGAAHKATLSRPHALVLDRNGDIYLSDTTNHRVRVIDAETCEITTIAGTGAKGYSGDNGPGLAADLSRPHAGVLDTNGHFFFADLDNHVVRRVDRETRIITTVAGIGVGETSGDGGPATEAGLNSPRGLAVDADNNLYITTHFGNRVRVVDAQTGIITTIAGTGEEGNGGDGGPALEASFHQIQGTTISPQGDIIIADWGNRKVRRIRFQQP